MHGSIVTRFARFLFSLVCLYPFALGAEAIVPLEPGRDKYDSGRAYEVLEDPDGKLTFANVRSAAHADEWRTSDQDVLNFAFSDSVFWVRTRIENPGERERDLILELAHPLHDYVDGYIEEDGGAFRKSRTGDRRSFATREIDHPHFLFPVRVPGGQSRMVYLRLASHDGLHEAAPLVLRDRDTFDREDSLAGYVNGLLFGITLIMLFYNLFVFVSLRDRSYLYYVFLLSSACLWIFSYQGMAFRVLWPGAPAFGNAMIPVSSSLIFLSVVLYSRLYLDTPGLAPRFDRLIQSGYFIWGAILIYSLFGTYKLSILFVMLGILYYVPVLLATAVMSLWRGHRPAFYFLLAFGMCLLGVVLLALKVSGMLPSNALTEKGLMFGFALAVLMLALGLADRINVIREERAAAQAAALEKETLARRAQERSAADLKRMNELKDAFLANTSHELRTPLNGIIGLADALGAGVGRHEPERVERSLALIAHSGRRLSNLVGDILDFEKLRKDDIDIEARRVDLHSVVGVVLELIEPVARGDDIELRNEVPIDFPPVLADEARLEQILHNLLSNALKYTDRGSIRVSAKTGTNETDMIEISVEDTGIGIPEDSLERIFESFTQVYPRTGRKYAGTGLGLSITRRLVELHGGRIACESRPGQGSRFHFTLPRAMADAPMVESPIGATMNASVPARLVAIEPPKIEVNANTSSDDSDQPVVLLVDDEPVNLEVMRSHLELAGFGARLALNGLEAQDHLKHNALPDLIVLDVMMPYVSGLELARELRGTYSLTELPILMVTARTRTEDLMAAMNAGANDYLTKPFEWEEFLLRVTNLVSLARSHRDTRAAVREAAREERARINSDLHDHLGASLTALKLFSEAARANPAVDAEFAAKLEGMIGGALKQLRGDLLGLEDLGLLEEDFLEGAHMIALRRYVEAGRLMNFRAPETGRAELKRGLDDHRVGALYAVLKEMVTNDLKYGAGASVWEFDWDESELRIDFQGRSSYRLERHGSGRGTAGMLRRLSEVGGSMQMSLEPAESPEAGVPDNIEIAIRMPLVG